MVTKLQPVILAGGASHRLWPSSQQIKPKQFLRRDNQPSLFQQTVIRNQGLGKILVVANIAHYHIVTSQLAEINANVQTIFEPEVKNTAISAILATLYAKSQGFDTVALLPSDHSIEQSEHASYQRTLHMAINTTEKYGFSTIGLEALSSDPNFGYLRAEKLLTEDVYIASEFCEKPSQEIADRFKLSEKYFWNSGIYVFNIEHALKLATKFLPLVTKKLTACINSGFDISVGRTILYKKELYREFPAISFDKAIMEHLKNIPMIKGDFGWRDIGNWASMYNHINHYEPQSTHTSLAATFNLREAMAVFKNNQLVAISENSQESVQELLAQLQKML